MHDTDATTMVSRRKQERRGRGVAQPVDLVVDRPVLLDEGVGARDVRLGLVVVVVGDEELDPVLGNISLSSEASWAASDLLGSMMSVGRCSSCDGPGDGGGLAAAGDALEGLVASPRPTPSTSAAMAAGWSPAGAEGGHHLEIGAPPDGTGGRVAGRRAWAPRRGVSAAGDGQASVHRRGQDRAFRGLRGLLWRALTGIQGIPVLLPGESGFAPHHLQ